MDKEQKIIELLRKELKKVPIVLEKLKKYNEDPDFIDTIPIRFEPLDVSAKTVNGEIILNSHLLQGEFRDNLRYLTHEFIHTLQQANNKVDETSQNKDYLDDPNELEAFKGQIDYMKDHYSNEEMQDYIEQLLDHHNLEGYERREKIKELLSKRR